MAVCDSPRGMQYTYEGWLMCKWQGAPHCKLDTSCTCMFLSQNGFKHLGLDPPSQLFVPQSADAGHPGAPVLDSVCLSALQPSCGAGPL